MFDMGVFDQKLSRFIGKGNIYKLDYDILHKCERGKIIVTESNKYSWVEIHFCYGLWKGCKTLSLKDYDIPLTVKVVNDLIQQYKEREQQEMEEKELKLAKDILNYIESQDETNAIGEKKCR